jgi:hypothetical protein
MNDNSYNSLERLMELGMSMAIAQQMMQTMNTALSQMQTPTFKNVNVQLPTSMACYAIVNGIPQGPFNENEMTSHIQAARITKDTLVWLNGMPGWLEAGKVAEVAKLFLLVPPSL